MIVDSNNRETKKLNFLGTDYGGWGIDLTLLNQESIVYSFGVGTDISFDKKIIEIFGCKVYAFDPTPRCLEWIKTQNLPKNFEFIEFGLSDFDGVSFFDLPPKDTWVSFSETKNPKNNSVECEVKTLKTIMRLLNHVNIDVLKIDIEGSEYHVIPNILENKIFPKQILVEFHDNYKNKINELLELLNMYEVYKRIDRNDYYLILKDV